MTSVPCPRAEQQRGVLLPATLYISYDGVLEPLGESQILPYVLGLAREFRLTLVTFEKAAHLAETEKVREVENCLQSVGVRWIRLRYHKRPLIWSTLWDILTAVLVIARICLSQEVVLVHARGYVPALIAVLVKTIVRFKILFATEGFWADEKVVAGHWSSGGLIYRITKRCERLFYESADAIVSLTHEARQLIPSLGYRLRSGVPLEVISTCTDLERFRPGAKSQELLARLGLTGYLVIGCVGTMHNWYLRKPMLDYMAYLVQHLEGTKILVVTLDNHQQLWADARAAGLPADRLVVTMSDFSAMPEHIRLMDFGFFFIEACFAKKGSNPTKLGEFLACGVPVVINDGVGDSGWIVRENRVGVVLREPLALAFGSSLAELRFLIRDPEASRRCRLTAQRYFDVASGIERYAGLYRRLLTVSRSAAGLTDR